MGNTRDLSNRINESYSRLSKGQKLLATYITDNYDKAVFLTAARLGEVVGVSESTVVRFATHLGYKGYPEFQNALEELVRNKLNSIQRMEVTYGRISQSKILESVLHSDADKINTTLEKIDQEAFEIAVNTILNAKHIYIIGIRSCAPLASFMAFYFNLMFDNVHLLQTSSSSVFATFLRFFMQSATISALMTLSGATRESTIEAISLSAIRLQEEYRFIGECTLSVNVITFALRLFANSIAFKVRME